MKSCRNRGQRQTTDLFYGSYISTHRGAREVSCPEIHGPAAMWRSMLRDLPQGDRAGYVRRQGSVVIVDLESLMHRKERIMSADTTVASMSMHPRSGGPKAL